MMDKFKKGDIVIDTINSKRGIVKEWFHKSSFSFDPNDIVYKVDYDNGESYWRLGCYLKLANEEIEGKENMKNNEEKELKRDVEILLNLYLQNRKMNKKEIKRFSDRHFDIIEKQNAKKILKNRGE